MYRWLMLGPVLLFCAISAVVAGRLTAAMPTGPGTAASGFVHGPGRLAGLVGVGAPVSALVANIGLLLAGVLLIWLAAFRPGGRYPVWLATLKYLAMLGTAGLAAVVLAYRGSWTGLTAAVLATQARKPLIVLLAAAWLPQALPEAVGLSAVLAAPLYWLVRSIQVRSLQRATFESWAETRRLILPAALVLLAAAALGAWAAPAVVTWTLR